MQRPRRLVFAAGETWDMRGYECAKSVGSPPGLKNKAGAGGIDGEDDGPFRFESSFSYLTATRVKLK